MLVHLHLPPRETIALCSTRKRESWEGGNGYLPLAPLSRFPDDEYDKPLVWPFYPMWMKTAQLHRPQSMPKRWLWCLVSLTEQPSVADDLIELETEKSPWVNKKWIISRLNQLCNHLESITCLSRLRINGERGVTSKLALVGIDCPAYLAFCCCCCCCCCCCWYCCLLFPRWFRSMERSWAHWVTPKVEVEVLLYVHRNRRLIRDGSPGCPPRLSHSSWALTIPSTTEVL